MGRRIGFGLLALTGALAVGARPAEAASIDYLGSNYYSVVNVSGPVSGNVYAGQIEWAWIGTPPSGFERTFSAFCIDIKSYLADPQVVTPRSTDAFNPVADAGAKAAWLVNTFSSTISGAQASVMAAALQVAIWEVIYDASNDLLAGAFKLNTTGDILKQAQGFLAALNTPTGSYHTASGVWLDTNYGQDQIVVPAPQPGTLALLALGACVLMRNRVGTKRCALAYQAN